MKKSRLLGVLCACVMTLVSLSTNAALIGVLPATPGGTDYQAYYDDVADLTWLADATASGTMIWDDAMVWAANLDINGVTGWRLPEDDSCHGYNCTNSELGNLYYNVFNGVAIYGITSINVELQLFSNVRNHYYHTSTKEIIYYTDPPGTYQILYWAFDTIGGYQGRYSRHGFYAWAVHDGNAGAAIIPIPPALWLFGSGLLGLIGVARKKRQ